jgi:hypothetical protein
MSEEPTASTPRVRAKIPVTFWVLASVVTAVSLAVNIGAGILGAAFIANPTAMAKLPGGSSCATWPLCGSGEARAAPDPSPSASKDLGIFGTDTDWTLDLAAPFGGSNEWRIPMPRGWDIVHVDQEGVDEFSNSVSGCTFIVGTVESPSTREPNHDEAGSLADRKLLDAEYTGDDTIKDVRVQDSSTVWVPIGGGGQGRVQFLSDFVYFDLVDGGEPWVSETWARTFSLTGAVMYATLECPASSLGGGSPMEKQSLDLLSID